MSADMADDSFKRYIEEQLREQSFLEEAPMLPQSFHANSVHAQKLLDTGIAGIAAPIAGELGAGMPFHLHAGLSQNPYNQESNPQHGHHFQFQSTNQSQSHGMCIPSMLSDQDLEKPPNFHLNPYPPLHRGRSYHPTSAGYGEILSTPLMFRDDSHVEVVSSARATELKGLDPKLFNTELRRMSKDDSFLSFGSGSNASFGKILMNNAHLFTDQFNDSTAGLPNQGAHFVAPQIPDDWKCGDESFDEFVAPSDPVPLRSRHREPKLQLKSYEFSNQPHVSRDSETGDPNMAADWQHKIGGNTVQNNINSQFVEKREDLKPETLNSSKSGGGIFHRMARKASEMRKKDLPKDQHEQPRNIRPGLLQSMSWRGNRKRSASISNLNSATSLAPSSFPMNIDKDNNDAVPSLPASPILRRVASNPIFSSTKPSQLFHWNRPKSVAHANTAAYQNIQSAPSKPIIDICQLNSAPHDPAYPASTTNKAQSTSHRHQLGHIGWSELQKFFPRLDRTTPGVSSENTEEVKTREVTSSGLYITTEQASMSQVLPNRPNSFQRFVQPKRLRTDAEFAPLERRSVSTRHVSWEPGRKVPDAPVPPQVSSARRGAAARRPRFKGRFMRTSNVWTSITEIQRPKATKESVAKSQA